MMAVSFASSRLSVQLISVLYETQCTTKFMYEKDWWIWKDLTMCSIAKKCQVGPWYHELSCSYSRIEREVNNGNKFGRCDKVKFP
jgi:hypothetical protein